MNEEACNSLKEAPIDDPLGDVGGDESPKIELTDEERLAKDEERRVSDDEKSLQSTSDPPIEIDNIKDPVEAKNSQDINEAKKAQHEVKLTEKCEVCGKRLKSRVSLIYHRKSHQPPPKPFLGKCQSCSLLFFEKIEHLRHMALHKEDKKPQKPGKILLKCLVCFMSFNNKKLLLSHLEEHLKPKQIWRCNVCCVPFALSKFLRNHIIDKHSEVSESCLEELKAEVKRRKEAEELNFVAEREAKLEIARKQIANLTPSTQANSNVVRNSIIRLQSMCSKRPSEVEKVEVKRVKKDSNPNSPEVNVASRSKTVYACLVCRQTFEDKKFFLSHLESHLEPKEIWNCNVCLIPFDDAKLLRHHIFEEHFHVLESCLDELDNEIERRKVERTHPKFIAQVETAKRQIEKLKGVQPIVEDFEQKIEEERKRKEHLWKWNELQEQAKKERKELKEKMKEKLKKPKILRIQVDRESGVVYAFHCLVCFAPFKSKDTLLLHLNDHLKMKDIWRCKFCSNSFEAANLLRQHIIAEHSDKAESYLEELPAEVEGGNFEEHYQNYVAEGEAKLELIEIAKRQIEKLNLGIPPKPKTSVQNQSSPKIVLTVDDLKKAKSSKETGNERRMKLMKRFEERIEVLRMKKESADMTIKEEKVEDAIVACVPMEVQVEVKQEPEIEIVDSVVEFER